MAKTRKTVFPRDLLNYEVLIEDTSENSVYFNTSKIPQLFTGGKNSFLIDGSVYLKNGSKVLVEIIDSRGNNIYQTVVKNYVEGTSVLISVEIYPQTPPGFATIIIMGQAARRIDGTNIPNDWNDTYNVRWTKKVMVEPVLKNSSPLKFANSPKIETLEEKRFYSLQSSSVNTVDTAINVKLIPKLNASSHKGYYLVTQDGSRFSANMLGGYLTGSVSFSTNGVSNSAVIRLLISDILNTSTAVTEDLIKTIDGTTINSMILQSGSYSDIVFGNFTSTITSDTVVRYDQLNKSTETKIPISYAKIKVFNLNTVSGDVTKIRVYNKVFTDASDYKLVADVPIITNELLISESKTGIINIGDFYSTPDASDHWYADELSTGDSILYPISGTSEYYDSSQSLLEYTTPFSPIFDGTSTGLTTNTFIKPEIRGLFTASFTAGITSSNNNTFIKTGSTNDWNTEVYSTQGYSSSIFVSAIPTWMSSSATQSVIFGLTTNPTLNTSSSIDYAWYLSESGDLQIVKTGSYVTASGTFTTASVLKIVYENNTVKYIKDNIQTYSEPRTVSGGLYFDSTFFYTSSQGLTDVKFGRLAEWDSHVYSVEGYSENVLVSALPTWQPTLTTQSVMFGLTTNPTASTSTSSIDFAWYLSPSGIAEIYKNGSFISASGNYTPSTRLTVQLVGDTIKYIKNNIVKHTEIRNTSAPLYFDSSFLYSSSQGITDVNFGPLIKQVFFITEDDDTLMSSIYADVPLNTSTNQFSGSVANNGYFIGNRSSILVSNNTEYTLTLDAHYKKQMDSVILTGNSPTLDIYIIGVSGSQVVSENPLGQLIGKLEPTGEVSRFDNISFNFKPVLTRQTGTIGIRFIVKNGFWNLSNISLKAAADGLFPPDEVDLVIPNTDYYNSLLQYKLEFFDLNNNSANVIAVSTPTFFTGSNIDLGVLP
jgi:hypothetical protein